MSRVVEVIQYGTAATGGRRLKVEAGRVGPQGAQGPAGQGVPVGGSTGQVLSKVSDTDYDTTWSTVSGGGGAPAAHAASHQDGGSDELALDASQITSGTVSMDRLADSGVPAASTYLNGASDLDRPTAVFNRVTFSDADYTVTSPFSVLVVQTGTLSATRTVTLPDLSNFTFAHPGVTFAQQVLIWSGAGVSPSNKLVVAAASGQTINGAATFEITEANRLVTINSNRLISPTATNPSWIVEPRSTTWRLIADDVLLVDTASVSYTITGYDQVHVIVSARSTRNSTSDTLNMTVNSDTSSVYSTNAAALTTEWAAGLLPAITTNTDRHQHVDIRLSLTDGYTKAGYSLRSSLFSTSTVGGTPTLTGLFSTLTGAVTSIQLAGNLGDLAAGSHIRVLGLEA